MKEYIGDAIYVENDNYGQLILTTGKNVLNRVVFSEKQQLYALFMFIDKIDISVIRDYVKKHHRSWLEEQK